MGQVVWVLRESFLAYERFHGVYDSKDAAKAAAGMGQWAPIKRNLPPYMWDELDPFDSKEGAEFITSSGSLWIVEPQVVRTLT